MSVTTLGGVPAFLRVLTMYPSPDAVMSAVVDGPMAAYDAAAARFWLLDGEDLVHVGGHGYTQDESDRYSIVVPGVPFAVWTAVRERRIVLTSADTPRPAALDAVDQDFRLRMLRRRAIASVVRTPLLLDGEVVGAMGIALRAAWPDDDAARTLLSTLASALALWATTPASGAAEAMAGTRARARSLALVFSDRECDILRLVEARVPTGAIARTLHVSESTVKSHLQAAMRALGTDDRVEAAARARALGLLD